MLALILAVAASMPVLQADTVVVLGVVERDLTGDQVPEVLRLVGTGASIDSLDVTFSIASSGTVIFETQLRPLTRNIGFDAGRRTLSAAEHRERLEEFGGWFFGDEKFMRPAAFVAQLHRNMPRHVARIPHVIARAAADTASAGATWEAIRDASVTVFSFSPGGDAVRFIAWSLRERRFVDLVECC